MDKKEGCAAPVENGAAALFVPSDEHVKAAKQAAINAFVMQTGGDEALHNQADAIAAGESTAASSHTGSRVRRSRAWRACARSSSSGAAPTRSRGCHTYSTASSMRCR